MKKRWLALAGLLLLVIAASIIWTGSSRGTPRQFVLPDSNRVTLVAVVVGTNSAINFGNPAERVLAHLPGKLGKQFRRNTVEAGMEGGTNVTFWFCYDRPQPNDRWMQVRFISEGTELYASTFYCAPRTLANGKTVAYWETHLWPRRDKTFSVEISTFRGSFASPANPVSNSLGKITVPNPDYRKYPDWTPETLPATRHIGNISFTLERLGNASFIPDPFDRYPVRIRITSGEKSETAWEAWNCHLRDVTGNTVPPARSWPQRPLRETASGSGVVRLPITWYGMPREKAWKLGIQFVRTGQIASNEVFVLRGVPVTTTGGWSMVPWTTNLPSGVIQFRHEPDWDDPANRPWCFAPVEPERIDYENPSRNPPCVLILAAVNDQGERIEPIQQRKIRIPPASKALDITIATPLQYFIEYVIDPELLLLWNTVPQW